MPDIANLVEELSKLTVIEAADLVGPRMASLLVGIVGSTLER